MPFALPKSTLLGYLTRQTRKCPGKREEEGNPPKIRKEENPHLSRKGCWWGWRSILPAFNPYLARKKLPNFALVSRTAQAGNLGSHARDSLPSGFRAHNLKPCLSPWHKSSRWLHIHTNTHRAAAPEMISISSLVMTAWRVRLNVSVSLSIISAGKRQGWSLNTK